jgi:hypothetical protein
MPVFYRQRLRPQKKKRQGTSPAFSMMLEITALFLFAVFMVFVFCVLAVHFGISSKHRSSGHDREHCGKCDCEQFLHVSSLGD